MKRKKLRICNWVLLVLTVITLISSIQLEATGSRNPSLVVFHIIFATIFIAFICWHIALNSNPGKHHRRKNRENASGAHSHKILGWVFFAGLLTTISAIAATIHWSLTATHAGIGGVHGKLGFLFLILLIPHITKYRRFYILGKHLPKSNLNNH